MPERDWLALMVLGGAFLLLGVGAIIWGQREERGYYNALATRFDVREFLSHWPPRIEPKALRIGGWIAVILGLGILITAGILMLARKVS